MSTDDNTTPGRGEDGVDPDETARIEPPSREGGRDERADEDREDEASGDSGDTARIDSSTLAAAGARPTDGEVEGEHPWEADEDDHSAVVAGGGGSHQATSGSGSGSGGRGPAKELPEEKSRNPWLGIVVRTLIVVVVLGGLYIGLAQYFGGRIPGGTTVEGVDIGGLTPDAATERLEARLGPLSDDPVVVIADGERYEVDPAEAGLSIDIETTIDGLTGVSYDPRTLFRQITGSEYELDVIARTDVTAVRDQVGTFADDVTIEPVEGSIELIQGAVQAEESENGLELDVNQTSELVVQGWPHTREIEAVVSDVSPALTNEEIERFVSEEAEPALASSIVVKVDDVDAVITENQLARLLTIVQSDDNTLSLEMDEETVLDIVRDSTGDVVGGATDATVQLSGGEPEIIPSEDGAELDEEGVIEAVRGVLTNPDADARTVEVDPIPVEPDFTTEDAEGWNFEVMSDFSSEFPTGPSNEARTENLRVGMGHINGTVIMPGEQFSLSEVLSPVDADHGYVAAGVISNGQLVQGMGGGLSQVSTTVLNGAWDAGVQLDEFQPHSYYIDRYPEGKEATLAIGVIDNKWTNDTDTPIVVRAWVRDSTSELRIRFYGDPQYEVETHTSDRSNFRQPSSDTSDTPGCLPQPAVAGFDVTVTRILSSGGDEVSRQSWTTNYAAADAITCV